jgi:hypothetical protein
MDINVINFNLPGTETISCGSICYMKFIKLMGILQEIGSSGVCQKFAVITETTNYFSSKLILKLYHFGVLSQQFTRIKLLAMKN